MTDAASSPNKQALFSTPADAREAVQTEIGRFDALDQKSLALALNQHTTQIYSYDGRVAATLKVPGFSDNAADASSQCLIYDQAHYATKTVGDYDYDFGWTQRLVIKVTKWDVHANLTIPSAVAASCDMGASSAAVQYVVRGLSGPYKDLTGEAAQFGVDQFAQYRIKMQALFDDLENGKMSVVPVIVARQRTQDSDQANNKDLYRGYAYRLSGLAGILSDRTVDEFVAYATTKGRDSGGKPQKIADENYFRQCIESAYSDYRIASGQRLSDLPKPDRDTLESTIMGDTDGFTVSRRSF